MSKEQMLAARELIKHKQYDQARVILENIDHPKAKEWLMKLDGMAPSKSTVVRAKVVGKSEHISGISAKKHKKPGFRYFLVYGLIFIILLGGMFYAGIAFLEDDGWSDGAETASVPTWEDEIIDAYNAEMTADAATLQVIGTPIPEVTEESGE